MRLKLHTNFIIFALCLSAALPLQAGKEQKPFTDGTALMAEKNWPGAEVKFQKAVEIKTDYVEAWNMLGEAQFNQSHLNDAIYSFKKAETINPRLTEAVYNLGWAYENQHKDSEYYEVDNEDVQVYKNPKLIKKIRKTQNALAEAAYRRAINIEPVTHRRSKANAHYRLGNLLMRKELKKADAKDRDFLEAVQHEEAAVALFPDFYEARNELGKLYDLIGRYPSAIEQFDKAIKENKNYAQAWSNRGVAWWHDGNWDNALRDTRMAIQLDDNFAMGHFNFAEVVFARAQVLATDEKRAIKREEIERAIKHFVQATEIEHAINFYPEFYDAWIRVGDSYLAYHDLNKAEAHYLRMIDVIGLDEFSDRADKQKAKRAAKNQLKWIKNERKRLNSHIPRELRPKKQEK